MKYVILLIILKTIVLLNIAISDNYQLEIYFTNKSKSLNLFEYMNYIHINSRGVGKTLWETAKILNVLEMF